MIPLLLAAALTFVQPQDLRVRAGDDPSWAAAAHDDSSWERTDWDHVQAGSGVTWIRTRVDLTLVSRGAGRPLGIYFGGLASHELWWDGVKIGAGGVVGRSAAEERPGPIEAHYQIPDRLTGPGTHTLAVRLSAFHRGFEPQYGLWGVVIAEYDAIVQMRTRSVRMAAVALSGIVVTAVFAFALFWLTRRDRSFLILAALCVAAAALLAAEAWRPLFGYSYDVHIVRLLAVVMLSWCVGVLLVWLVIARFPLRFARAVLVTTAAVAAVAAFIPRGWDSKSVLIFAVCCTVSSGWTLLAARRHLHGSGLALAGTCAVLLALVADPWALVDNLLYGALNVFFICMLASHALEVRREQQEKARLQLEILRRQMQPHFLMNTLTAVSEWIEEEPRTAIRLIEALADELRMLADMSARTLVTAEEELRLCRSHLANMSLRKDVTYELEVDGVDGRSLVPPALFHTLVENAITHSAPAERVTMKLTRRVERNRAVYTFEAPADGGEAGEREHGGAGSRYIRARLREAWGEAWSFRQGRQGASWRAEIEVPA
jgi:hypothetical protein